MAGLYVVFDPVESHRLDAVASRMRFSNESERRFESEISYVWLGHDDVELFAPAIDPASGVHVVVGGRLCWPQQTLNRAKSLPFEGGIANRVILERYLKEGGGAIAPYNGAATIMIWDPRSHEILIWTDQFGYHPAFLYGSTPEQPEVFTTFPEAIKADYAIQLSPDYISMAEFLRAWRVTPPHTYYEQVKHLGAATKFQLSIADRQVTKNEYWRPFESEFFSSEQEAADALASALRAAVSERTSMASRVTLFVSGGADSRVMLFGADDPTRITGVNLYETPTPESVISRELCQRAGAQYIGFGRDGDYYPRMQAENVRWSGGMWSTEDNHYLGVKKVIDDTGADLVMTACTTDWVFKGYGLEKTYRQLLGKNLPIKQFINNRVDGFLPNYPRESPPKYADAIAARMDSWFAGCPNSLVTDRDRLLVEDRRIRPTCYTVSVSGQIMYRTYPYDTFLADSRVAECYGRLPAKWKLNGEVWGKAAAIVCKNAKDIVDANFGWKVDAGPLNKLISFSKGWASRRVSRATSQSVNSNDHPPCWASWPQFGWYAEHSKTLQKFWQATPASDRELLTQLWGSDPWATPLHVWAKNDGDLMRILTLLQHWRNT